MSTKNIPIAIIGSTGYTGLELVRLLTQHPRVTIKALTSRQYAGKKFSDVYPALFGQCDLVCEKLNVARIAKQVRAVFICLPHHDSMPVAASFRSKGVRVIDLSADFRIKDHATYEKWYGKHTQKKLLKEAVYGLPELYRAEIEKAKLVASPGCYPTSILLALAPLIKAKLIKLEGIVADSKSGTSGAGRAALVGNLFCEVNDSLKAYKVAAHRHTPEIEQELSVLAGRFVKILFTPHLVPMDRGIFSTIYCQPKRKTSTKDLLWAMDYFYKKEKFVKVLPAGHLPSTKNVRGTNNCHLSAVLDSRTQRIIVLSAIDNLTKGASGQAVQAFNLMFGLQETMGLEGVGVVP